MGYLLFPPAPPVQREGQIDRETERDGGGSSGQSPLTRVDTTQKQWMAGLSLGSKSCLREDGQGTTNGWYLLRLSHLVP